VQKYHHIPALPTNTFPTSEDLQNSSTIPEHQVFGVISMVNKDFGPQLNNKSYAWGFDWHILHKSKFKNMQL